MCLDDLLIAEHRAAYLKRVHHALKWAAIIAVVAVIVTVTER